MSSASRGEPRLPLTRARIVQAAVMLADTEGLAALSMRKLGRSLAVEAMSLYNHIANKDDLFDGMVDLVFREVGMPPDELGWQEAMRQRAIAMRDTLIAHPWALGLLGSRNTPGQATLRHHNAVLGCFRRAGFSVALAAHAYSLLDSYIYGFALEQLNLPFNTSEEAVGVAEALLEQFSADQYPYLSEITNEYILQPGYEYADELLFGLNLILDGLARLHSLE